MKVCRKSENKLENFHSEDCCCQAGEASIFRVVYFIKLMRIFIIYDPGTQNIRHKNWDNETKNKT